jgi:hypothetical protein
LDRELLKELHAVADLEAGTQKRRGASSEIATDILGALPKRRDTGRINMSKAAFIGLGAMGSRMAANLLKSGHEVTVCDLAPGAVKKLADIGAKTAASARQAAEGNDFVLTMVRDDEISRKVWLDTTTGALAGMKPGGIAIENLLPSCISCNQPGEHNIGKRTRFPTANGYYVTPEQDVGAEQPLLINPVDPADDDPETHLTVDFETGNLTHPNSARGAKCIEVFGLNKRDQLVTDRNTALNDVKADFVKVVFASPAVAQQLIDKLKRMEGGGFSHTLARRAQLKELKRRYGL